MRAFSGIAAALGTAGPKRRSTFASTCRSPRVPVLGRFPRMALRLTSNSPTSDDARLDGGSVALRATGAFGATLAGKARALLIAGDIDAYRALFSARRRAGGPQRALPRAGTAARGRPHGRRPGSHDDSGRPAVRRRRQGRARRARRAAQRADHPLLRRRRALRAVGPRRRACPVRGGAAPGALAAAHRAEPRPAQGPPPQRAPQRPPAAPRRPGAGRSRQARRPSAPSPPRA